jgi:glutamyl-tRNA reductase
VDKDIESLSWALVYNVDDINNRTTRALERRIQSIPQVEQIITESLAEFNNWTQEMAFSPTIQKFKEALEDIRQEEIQRHMKKMDAGEYEKVDKITKSILNKIIRMPVLQLKAACRRGEAEMLTEVLQELFDLERTPEAASRTK